MKSLVPQTVESVPIDELRSHPKNPRQGDVGAITLSIKANGLYRPLYVQRSTGHILAGNHTWKALKAAGETHAPVIWLDVSDDAALRILLADNRVADLGSYDNNALESLLMELTPSLEGTGYDTEDLERMVARSQTPLKFPEHQCCRPAEPDGQPAQH